MPVSLPNNCVPRERVARCSPSFSETFPTHDAALKAARRVANEQRVPGESTYIQYQTGDGQWHTEHVLGSDRPEADVTG